MLSAIRAERPTVAVNAIFYTKDGRTKGMANATLSKVKTDKAVSKVTLTLGLVTIPGGIYSVTRTDDTDKFHLTCPDCKSPTQHVAQRYVCQENPKHGPFAQADCLYGKEADGKIVTFSQEKVKEARASVLPKSELVLQIHPRDQVEAATFPAGSVYVFQPTVANNAFEALADEIKKRRDLVFLVKYALRDHDHLSMLDFENGQLVVRDLVWPEERKEFSPVVISPPTKVVRTMMESLVEAVTEDFVPDEYTKEAKVRITTMVAETSAGAPQGASPKKVKKLAEDDLAALLEQSVGLVKTRKAS